MIGGHTQKKLVKIIHIISTREIIIFVRKKLAVFLTSYYLVTQQFTYTNYIIPANNNCLICMPFYKETTSVIIKYSKWQEYEFETIIIDE